MNRKPAVLLRHRLSVLSRKVNEKKYRHLAQTKSNNNKRRRDDEDDNVSTTSMTSTTTTTTPVFSACLSEITTWPADETAMLANFEKFIATLRDAKPLPPTTSTSSTHATTSSTNANIPIEQQQQQQTKTIQNCVLQLRNGKRLVSDCSSRALW